jgi:hypothetical protein
MKKSYLWCAFGFLLTMTPAIWAAGGFDRVAAIVKMGQGTAITEQLIFDTGAGGSNAIVQSDSTQHMTLAGNTVTSAAPFIAGNQIGVGAAPAYPIDIYGSSGDYAALVAHAGTSSGVVREYFLPPTGTTPRFEIDGSFGSPNELVFESDTNTLMTMNRNGTVTTPGPFVASDGAAVSNGLSVAGGANITSGGLISGGGGTAASQAFKTALYSGSITSTGSITITVPGQIMGYLGYETDSTNPSGVGNPGPIIDAFTYSNPGTNQPRLQIRKIASNTSFNIINTDNDFAHSYICIVFYQ